MYVYIHIYIYICLRQMGRMEKVKYVHLSFNFQLVHNLEDVSTRDLQWDGIKDAQCRKL